MCVNLINSHNAWELYYAGCSYHVVENNIFSESLKHLSKKFKRQTKNGSVSVTHLFNRHLYARSVKYLD